MATHKCEQIETIKQLEKAQTNLDINQKIFMDILQKLEAKVDDIHKFIFQGEMAKNYVTREMFEMTIKDFNEKINDKDKQIKKLEGNQNRIAWIIISAVLVAVIGLVIVPKF